MLGRRRADRFTAGEGAREERIVSGLTKQRQLNPLPGGCVV
jgi:hypothetical protein